MNKRPPLVEIEWDDAQTLYQRIGWDKIGECMLSHQVTSGYLHPSSDDKVTRVAHTYDPEEESPMGVDITIIPTGWIRSIRYKARKPRKKGTSNDTPPTPPTAD